MRLIIRVYFHADGGQCCTPTYKDFKYPEEEARAYEWYKSYLNERGHTCPNHTRLELITEE